jgi:RPA family protein
MKQISEAKTPFLPTCQNKTMIIVFGKVTMWTMKASRDTRRVNAELVSGVSEPASLSIVRD